MHRGDPVGDDAGAAAPIARQETGPEQPSDDVVIHPYLAPE